MTKLRFKSLRNIRFLHSRNFWAIFIAFIIVALLHYIQIIPSLSSISIFWGHRYTIERTLLLIPIIFSAFIYGMRGSISALIVSLIIMLPQVFIFPVDLIYSLVEIAGVFVVGCITSLLFWMNRSSITRSEVAERSLSRIIDGFPVATFVINNQHKVIHWNTAIEVLTKIKKKEVIGTGNHWKAFYGSNNRVLADMLLDQSPAEDINQHYQGQSRMSGLIEGAYEAEGYFLAPPSRTGKWLHITGSPIKDNEGKTIVVVESIEDITNRKNAEKALRESESNFRNVFESALDAIWVSDASGIVQNVNEAAAKLTGYTVEELSDSNLKLFLTGDSLEKYHKIQDSLVSKQVLNRPYEQRVIRKDGSEAVCMVNTSALIQNGEVKSFQSIARDVTEQKRLYDNLHYYLQEITRAQEEERKRVARELHDSTAQNLIAVMHVLENLLNDKSKVWEGQTADLWRIYDRIKDILQEVRRFSRDLRPSILDDLGLLPALEWLLEQIKTEYGLVIKLDVIETERRLSPEMELLLFRIVQESLMNVVKHARASRAEVEVRFEEKRVIVAVKDNGAGFVPPENISGLLHSGKLGLAGMQERVQLLGGIININSEPGKGTRITVEAPLQSGYS
jgi:PAS domain S-box-containing protein